MLKIKIAHVVHDIENGGIAKVIYNFVESTKDCIENVILTCYDTKIEHIPNCQIISLGLKKRNSKIKKIIDSIKFRKWLRNTKKKLNLEFTISHGTWSNYDNKKALILNEKNIMIVHVALDYAKGIKSLFVKRINNKTYSNDIPIVCVSKGLKNDLIEKYNINEDNIDVIYNPINLPSSKKTVRFSNNDGLIKLFSFGRLHEIKGQKYLLFVTKMLIDLGFNTELTLLGDGELYDELLELSKKLKIDNNFKLLGYKTNVSDYVTDGMIAVYTSLNEGFGNVIVESMYMGLPVISTNCKYGPLEIIDDSDLYNQHFSGFRSCKYGLMVNDLQLNSEEHIDEIINDLVKSVVYLSSEENYTFYSNKSLLRSHEFTMELYAKKWLNFLKKVGVSNR